MDKNVPIGVFNENIVVRWITIEEEYLDKSSTSKMELPPREQMNRHLDNQVFYLEEERKAVTEKACIRKHEAL